MSPELAFDRDLLNRKLREDFRFFLHYAFNCLHPGDRAQEGRLK